jgi:LAGLIDADG endonuclease
LGCNYFLVIFNNNNFFILFCPSPSGAPGYLFLYLTSEGLSNLIQNFFLSHQDSLIFFSFFFYNLYFFFYNFIIVLFFSDYKPIFNYFISITINGGNVVFKNLYDLIFLNTIIIYSFISNWSSTFLLSVLPIIPKINLPSNNELDHSNKKNIPNSKLNPWFITGFTDGEGCFAINIYKATTAIGWSVGLIFMLVAKNNPSNLGMFEEIKNFFGVGSIKVEKNGSVIRYWVTGLQDCLIIRNHFISYPLMTYKLVHFLLWSSIIDIIITKAHLNLRGFLQIVALKAHFPKGLSQKLLLGFPNYSPIVAPNFLPDFSHLNIHWIAGFINADGSFSITNYKQNYSQTKEICSISIRITQHNRSKSTLEAIQKFFNYGSIYSNKNGVSNYIIRSIKLINNFIERFEETQLLGAKALDYADFCKAVWLMNNKSHLTPEGLAEFKTIAAGMNSTRIFAGADSKPIINPLKDLVVQKK